MQLNIRTDPDFERELDTLVRQTGLKTRSAAIRHAVHATLERTKAARKHFDFQRLIGIAGKLNPHARFKSDDDLYKDGMP